MKFMFLKVKVLAVEIVIAAKMRTDELPLMVIPDGKPLASIVNVLAGKVKLVLNVITFPSKVESKTIISVPEVAAARAARKVVHEKLGEVPVQAEVVSPVDVTVYVAAQTP